MTKSIRKNFKEYLESLKNQGTYKKERIITTPQGAVIKTDSGEPVLNFCSNNYLGLASNRDVINAAKSTMDQYGFGLSSVRFICGTQSIHKELEKKLSYFLGTEDTILFSSAFDANGGAFEPLLSEKDVIISDELNHASIIDGIRLCKASRKRYSHGNMEELENILDTESDKRYRLIATDGVFSMDGDIADLENICLLAEKYNALVLVDDSHATGYIGKTGRGTSEYCDVIGKVDIITTTFGKALGGASGGAISGKNEIIEILRQRSRPYLFSNTLAPAVAGGTLKVLDMLLKSSDLRKKVIQRAELFKKLIKEAGFIIKDGDTAIVPVMIYDEKLAVEMAERLLEEGIYVIGFTYPVVPKGQARIRVQLSAAHSIDDVEKLVTAFTKTGKELKVIP